MCCWRRISVLLCLAVSSCGLYGKQLAVVIHTANSTNDISAAQLIDIVNIRTHKWSDGKQVTVVLRSPTADDMQLVLRRLFNMSPSQAQKFLRVHGGELMLADSDDAVLRFVATNPGALGIVDLYSITEDVKVLKVDGKLPVEQGYLLRGN